MEKTEFRVLIKHCFLMGKNTVQAKQWIEKCYPDSCPSKAAICRWFAEFKRGRTDTNDAERSGRPVEAVTPENIEINPVERHFLKILWKQGSNELVQIYKLKAVTYSATPACFLSTRVLKQLAIDEEDNFPIAANIVRQDVYLDDILSGCSNLKELEILKSELVQLFESAGIFLHKWCFSHSNRDLPDLQFDQLSEEDTVKTLGVLWNSSSDTVCLNVHITENLVIKETTSLKLHAF
ncbi:HTH_48 domain-containing protein [Nephila pilipes]|uniref:HTH_48 domain-containing protein n=1 Tax=Nephila pilipes TaxID=299642 RepID=A0A8X6N391_NEPPI|nr:HTH_48 domain-containing protein [Nephila pilipes]